jgi:hypothetical protein
MASDTFVQSVQTLIENARDEARKDARQQYPRQPLHPGDDENDEEYKPTSQDDATESAAIDVRVWWW